MNLDGKVALVTGAGNGIGRAEALELARHGAAVVVNDLGTSVAGTGSDHNAADSVAAEIIARGGQAVANYGDVGDWDAARGMVHQAVDAFGGLDILVNNAGIVRRSAILDLVSADVDTHMRVLFKGTIGTLHHAGAYWRDERAAGRGRRRSVVNTSSSAGVPGGVQEFSLYGSMKAAIASLTMTAALEWRALDVTVNAICPHASTRMDSFAKSLPTYRHEFDEELDPEDPRCTADVVTWLASDLAAFVTGQVFEVSGGLVRHWRPWSAGAEVDTTTRWTPASLATAVATHVFGTIPGGRVVER